MQFDFSPVVAGWPDLLRGARATVEVTAASLGLGCAVGLVVGLGRLEPKRRVLYAICSAYLLLIRGTPLLVQLFLLFFGLPQFGIVLPAFACGVLGLGLYSGAYVSEIVRGSIQSIARSQTLAAKSLGMTDVQVMRNVVLPQALVRMIPPLGNEFIALIKNSALVSLLTIPDLMHEGQKIIAVSYRSLEVYLAVAAVYLVLTGTTAWLLRRIENRLSASHRLV
ncbi:MAG: amino acid ABC transporter permease [Caldimonas sp.]